MESINHAAIEAEAVAVGATSALPVALAALRREAEKHKAAGQQDKTVGTVDVPGTTLFTVDI